MALNNNPSSEHAWRDRLVQGNPWQTWIPDSMKWTSDPRYWIQDSTSVDSGFQKVDYLWFWIPRLGFLIPKSSILSSTSKYVLDSWIRINLHGAKEKLNAMKGKLWSQYVSFHLHGLGFWRISSTLNFYTKLYLKRKVKTQYSQN